MSVPIQLSNDKKTISLYMLDFLVRKQHVFTVSAWIQSKKKYR